MYLFHIFASTGSDKLTSSVKAGCRAVHAMMGCELTMTDAALRVFRVPAVSQDQPDPPYSSASRTNARTRDIAIQQCLCGCRSCLCAATPVQPLPEIKLIIRVELPFPRPIPGQGCFLRQQFICHELPPIIHICPLPTISEAPLPTAACPSPITTKPLCPHMPAYRL